MSNEFHEDMQQHDKNVAKIKLSLSKTAKKEYERGVRDAMSVAVNIFNCPEYIREGVFGRFKLKS